MNEKLGHRPRRDQVVDHDGRVVAGGLAQANEARDR
jgi:hypothetical protein